MKRLASVIMGAWLACAPAGAQTDAPPEVVRSAIAAVEDLGDKVIRGEHEVAVERMYPQWKERMAKRKGGLAKLEQQLANVGQMMERSGLNIVSFEAVGEPRSYEVWPDGSSQNSNESMSYEKWLVLIPTLTKIRVMREGDSRARLIGSYGFQVAIATKSQGDWSFINGSDVSVADLRSLFITLPQDLELPEVRREMLN